MEREEIVNIDLPQWELLPDIGLYMDQVITLMDRTFSPALPKGEMTKSMVNNYVKVGLIPRPVGKKYDREHLAMLRAQAGAEHGKHQPDSAGALRRGGAGGIRQILRDHAEN